jgi:hypothetical protein
LTDKARGAAAGLVAPGPKGGGFGPACLYRALWLRALWLRALWLRESWRRASNSAGRAAVGEAETLRRTAVPNGRGIEGFGRSRHGWTTNALRVLGVGAAAGRLSTFKPLRELGASLGWLRTGLTAGPATPAPSEPTARWSPMANGTPGGLPGRPGVPWERPGVPPERPGVACERPDVPNERPEVSWERPWVPWESPGVACERTGVPWERPGVPWERPGVAWERPEVPCERPEVPYRKPEVPRGLAGGAALNDRGRVKSRAAMARLTAGMARLTAGMAGAAV